jgi:hypothetical protein
MVFSFLIDNHAESVMVLSITMVRGEDVVCDEFAFGSGEFHGSE